MEKQIEYPAMPAAAFIKGDKGPWCVWLEKTEYSKHPRVEKLSNSV